MTTSVDALASGALLLEQPSRGYRFNVDAVFLAEFAGGTRGTAFDLGAGVGAVGLLLATLSKTPSVTLVERDAAYADLAIKNVERNDLGSRARVLSVDVSALSQEHKGSASLVVCNPPYFKPGSGRAPAALKRDARMGEVGPFVRAARELLGRRGRACFVYPANDFATLLAQLRAAGLEPKRARCVHATTSSRARVVLVEAQAGKPGGLAFEAPLIERA